MPAVEPTFLELSDNAIGPIEGGNTEDRGDRVGSDVSYFRGGATNRICGTGDSDKVTVRVTRGGDRDDKGCIF